MNNAAHILLTKVVASSSQGKIAKEIGISKTSVNLLLKGKYPNPQRMYLKIQKAYGERIEIVGAECTTKDIKQLLREIG